MRLAELAHNHGQPDVPEAESRKFKEIHEEFS